MEFKKHKNRFFKHLIATPFIYAVFLPLLLLDVFTEIYHRVCYPLYGFRYVKRSDYIRIDRHKLRYLNVFEKINCVYCGYANGLAQYFVRIASDTEKYWCGIRHKPGGTFNEPKHHKKLLAYNDEEAYREFLNK